MVTNFCREGAGWRIEETRNRVKKAMDEMNFVPNSMTRSLVLQKKQYPLIVNCRYYQTIKALLLQAAAGKRRIQ
jgi:DNA-binding LacI/PurR family transcriptional regulator